MKIDLIIQALRTRCPSFKGRVGGSAEYVSARNESALAMPHAFVIPMADTAGDNVKPNGYRQTVRDGFAVCVALANKDPRGQHNANLVHDIRIELNKALLGWEMDDEYSGITYDGGQITELNRACLWYTYEYYAEFTLGDEDAYRPETCHQQELNSLGPFKQAHLTIDAIDIHGPDGIAEGVVTIELDQK